MVAYLCRPNFLAEVAHVTITCPSRLARAFLPSLSPHLTHDFPPSPQIPPRQVARSRKASIVLQHAKTLSSTFPGINPTGHATLSRRRSSRPPSDLKHNFVAETSLSLPLSPLFHHIFFFRLLPASASRHAHLHGSPTVDMLWSSDSQTTRNPGDTPVRPAPPDHHATAPPGLVSTNSHVGPHAEVCCPLDRDLSKVGPHSNPMLDTCPTCADPSPSQRRKGRLPIATLAKPPSLISLG